MPYESPRPLRKGVVRLVRLIPRLLFLAAASYILAISASSFARNPVRKPLLRTIEDTGTLLMEVDDRILLERRILNITLEAPVPPLRFNLYLDAPEPPEKSSQGAEIPVIYAAVMPFRYIDDPSSPNRNSIEFILGEEPPNPFTTEIVLPVDFRGVLRAEALYVDAEDPDHILQRIIRRYPINAGSTAYQRISRMTGSVPASSSAMGAENAARFPLTVTVPAGASLRTPPEASRTRSSGATGVVRLKSST